MGVSSKLLSNSKHGFCKNSGLSLSSSAMESSIFIGAASRKRHCSIQPSLRYHQSSAFQNLQGVEAFMHLYYFDKAGHGFTGNCSAFDSHEPGHDNCTACDDCGGMYPNATHSRILGCAPKHAFHQATPGQDTGGGPPQLAAHVAMHYLKIFCTLKVPSVCPNERHWLANLESCITIRNGVEAPAVKLEVVLKSGQVNMCLCTLPAHGCCKGCID